MALVFNRLFDSLATFNPACSSVCSDDYSSEFSDYRLVRQKDGTTQLHLVVAGYPKDRVQVSRNGDRLTVQATLPELADDSAVPLVSYGRMIPSKARADFALASSAVVDNARVVDGILTITLRLETQPDDATVIPIQ